MIRSVRVGAMDLLLLVLRKSWSFMALGIIVLVIIFALNVVEPSPQLRPIRDAVNQCIPIIAAIIVGVFAQGIGLIYKLFENAITKHLEELNNVAKKFFEKVKDVDRPAYFANEYPNVVGSYMLYMHIESPLCSSYKDVKAGYGELVEDMGIHWSSVSEVLRSLDRLCLDIDKHNSRVYEIERKLRGCLRNVIKRDVALRLRGANPDYLYNFVDFILFGHVIPGVVNDGKRFSDVDYDYIESMYRSVTKSFKLEVKDNSLRIGSFNIGPITPGAWRCNGDKLVVDMVLEVLRKFSNDLDKLTEDGQHLIKYSQNIAPRLREELEHIANAKFLPLTRLCRYIR